jgi:hypothetical protein
MPYSVQPTNSKSNGSSAPDPTEIKNVWQLLAVNDNCIIELRAISPSGSGSPITKHYRAENYKSLGALKATFERDAIKLNNDGYNIYTVMNPIRHEFSGKAAKDDDILHRKWLLIDIDKASSEKRPSTQEELDAARALAVEIANYLKVEAWGDPGLAVMSGNGYHLYYDLGQMTNTTGSADLVRAALAELARSFDTSSVKVDQVVYNASRITKVVGTVARKGVNTPKTPYRVARLEQL